MIDLHKDFNDREKAAMRWIAGQDRSTAISCVDVLQATPGLTDAECRRVLNYLEQRNAAEYPAEDRNDVVLLSAIEDVRWERDHPPAKEHWQSAKNWFFRQWWSVVIMVAITILGILATLRSFWPAQ